MTAEVHGRPVRAGMARGTVVRDGASALDRILVCEDLGRYLGDAGRGFGGLVGGPSALGDPASIPPGPPAVGEADLELLLPGDAVVVDGDLGIVHLSDVRSIAVVTSFLERDDGRILLLLRSPKVGSFQGRWAGVSGFLEEPAPERQAVKEIVEETGIRALDLRLLAQAPPLHVRDGARMYVVHPFRYRVPDVEVHLDWEHTEAEWVEPSALRERPTVPRLAETWEAVARTAARPGHASAGKR